MASAAALEPGTANGKDIGENRGCWQRLGETRQFQVFGIVLLFLIVIGLAIFIGIKATAKTPMVNPKVCMTRECIESASKISSCLDVSVDPCQDFYSFTCGNYIKKNKIFPPGKDSMNPFLDLAEAAKVAVKNTLMAPIDPKESRLAIKVKQAYQTCIKELGSSEPPWKKLKSALDKNGFQYWPEVLSHWNDGYFDFTNALGGTLAAGFKSIIYFEKGMAEPLHIEIYPGTHSWFSDPSIRQDYRNLMLDVFNGMHVPKAKKAVDDVMEFESRLYDLGRVNENPKLIITSELERRYPEWNFTRVIVEYWKKLSDAQDEKNPEEFIFAVKADDLMNQAPSRLLAATPKKTLMNYMAWKFLFGAIKLSNLELRSRALILDLPSYKYRFGSILYPAWMTCYANVVEAMMRAVTFIYDRDMYSKSMNDEVHFYLNSVKKAFLKKVPDQTWLDEKTRQSVLNKVHNQTIIISYPREQFTEDLIYNMYMPIKIEENNFISSIISINHFTTTLDYYGMGRDQGGMGDWSYDPTDINAMNLQYANQIIIPIGILYPPFYQPNRPKYLNFGSLGFTLAHELGHTFDTSGIKYNFALDEIGWSPEMRQRHNEKAKCFMEQYSKYLFDGEGVMPNGVYIDGIKTINDNIADHISINYTYQALLQYQATHPKEPLLPGLKYTQEQLFFIQFGQIMCSTYSEEKAKDEVGDKHVPARFRVNGPLSNSPVFSEVFHCPKNSPMNRENKCQMFN